jgi:hypothetical protein
MAKEQEPAPADRFFGRPSEVRITVISDPDARTLWDRLATIPVLGRRPIVAVFVVLLAVTALVTAVSAGNRYGVRAEISPLVHDSGPAGVAAADGYPPRCLSITISAADPSYARADFNHATPCGRYTGYATAVFHRAGGAWRTLLKASEYECPVASIPVAVQADLDVCLPADLAPSRGDPPMIGHEYDRNYVITTVLAVRDSGPRGAQRTAAVPIALRPQAGSAQLLGPASMKP